MHFYFLLPLVLWVHPAISKNEVDIEVIANLAYHQAEGVDPQLLSLDIYRDRNDAQGDRPVLIYVHGGAWTIGDKANRRNVPDTAVLRGYVGVSINYRLTPDVVFPTHAQDVARAIAWVHQHITDYGGNPNKLFLIGHSAGAHLVTLVASAPAFLGDHQLSLSAIRGVIALDTRAYDIGAYAASRGGFLGLAFAPTFGQNAEFWAQASPATYVSADVPPTMIAYSGSGSVAERARFSGDYFQLLFRAGNRCLLVPAPQKSHSQILTEIGEENDMVTKVAFNFLDAIHKEVTRTWLPHITSPNGGFDTQLIIASAAAASSSFTLTAFDPSGKYLGVFQASLLPGHATYLDLHQAFGSEVPALLAIDQDTPLNATVVYRKQSGGSAAHVPLTTSVSTIWLFYPGDPAFNWDGLSVVNVGKAPSPVVLRHIDQAGAIIRELVLSDALEVGNKLLTLVDTQLPANTTLEISGSEPLALTVLRGTPDSSALWETRPIAIPEP